MKIWMALLAGVLMLAVTGIAEAKGHHKNAGAKAAATHSSHVSGKLVSVAPDGTSIVIKQGKKHGGAELTVQTDANTKVKIDKVAGKKVSDLIPGMHVKVTPATGVAQKIKARTHHKHHKHSAKTA